MIELPEVVKQKARLAGADRWLEGLPDLVASLEAEWSFALGPILEGGTEALVAEATCADGTEAVLKLLVPRGDLAVENEILVLAHIGGVAGPRLYRHDLDRGAMLMERLGPSLSDLGLPTEKRHEILCATARRFWRSCPDIGLQTGAEKASWLMDFILTKSSSLGRPASERAIRYALDCARRRRQAHDPSRSVLVHGDVHQWNALQAADGFKLIDPDGLCAEPEYDLGVIMREDPTELMQGDPRDRARHLADLTGRDVVAIWEWGVVERLSTGLLLTELGVQPVAGQMLAAAEYSAEKYV